MPYSKNMADDGRRQANWYASRAGPEWAGKLLIERIESVTRHGGVKKYQ